MSLRELVDPECGGANPLMRLGNHLIHDAAHKDDGIAGTAPPMVGVAGPAHFATQPLDETHLVNEFLGQMAAPPPQTFRMDALLREMRELDARNYPTQVMRAPLVSDEINEGGAWANEYQQGDASTLKDTIAIRDQVSGPRGQRFQVNGIFKRTFGFRFGKMNSTGFKANHKCHRGPSPRL